MQKVVLYLVAGALLLSSCSVHKKIAQPQLDLPDRIVEGLDHDTLCLADLSWMELFGDTLLVGIVEKTLQYNKDMLAASARIEEFERRHRVSRRSRFPEIGFDAYADRETNGDPHGETVEDIEVSARLSLSWEIDFFGRLRWADRAAKYDYLETIEARRALQMTLIAEVTSAYFELVALDKELEIVQNTLATRRENVHQAKLRFEGGLTSEIPYQQAQVELARTAALVPDLRLKIKEKENEISFLSGDYPSAVQRQSGYPAFVHEDLLSVGIPSDLIRRRPDVREAEMQFNGAAARAGISWADRFPRFVIGFDAGFEHSAFAGFFSSPLTYMIAELTSPVFSFGKRKAQYDAALAACQAQCHVYEKKVLMAFREVNDAVAAYLSSVENTHLMENLKTSSGKYLELALVQYLNGQINYMDVLDAQRSHFNAEIDHSNAVLGQYLALIDLYKALGGGWNS